MRHPEFLEGVVARDQHQAPRSEQTVGTRLHRRRPDDSSRAALVTEASSLSSSLSSALHHVAQLSFVFAPAGCQGVPAPAVSSTGGSPSLLTGVGEVISTSSPDPGASRGQPEQRISATAWMSPAFSSLCRRWGRPALSIPSSFRQFYLVRTCYMDDEALDDHVGRQATSAPGQFGELLCRFNRYSRCNDIMLALPRQRR